jgi:hypothetical protein
MPKAFLSHSSKQKNFLDIVAQKLIKYSIGYDSMTFEEGNKNIDEIIKELNSSDIFVLFISEEALQSTWVRTELDAAKKLLSEGKLKKILPLIIDKSITYEDERIPSWIRDDYNIRLINRPAKAADRIRQSLRLISWEVAPKNKALEQLLLEEVN